MIARWLNGRLLSVSWYWHAKNGFSPARVVCVHKLRLADQCWQCDDGVIPDNYTAQAKGA